MQGFPQGACSRSGRADMSRVVKLSLMIEVAAGE
jgi:hypothetical protein